MRHYRRCLQEEVRIFLSRNFGFFVCFSFKNHYAKRKKIISKPLRVKSLVWIAPEFVLERVTKGQRRRNTYNDGSSQKVQG